MTRAHRRCARAAIGLMVLALLAACHAERDTRLSDRDRSRAMEGTMSDEERIRQAIEQFATQVDARASCDVRKARRWCWLY